MSAICIVRHQTTDISCGKEDVFRACLLKKSLYVVLASKIKFCFRFDDEISKPTALQRTVDGRADHAIVSGDKYFASLFQNYDA